MGESLISKYNIPGPRYTSYPTVPYWENDDMSQKEWIETLNLYHENDSANSISVYIHLPFCESLCTFCGCHKRITKNHNVETPYIDTVIKEWRLYQSVLPFKPKIKELHLGGGTPTFFDVNELIRLVSNLFERSFINPDEVELSFEAHPNNTSKDHLLKLHQFGFRRVSFGIQDYSPTVQKAINRIQSYEQVKLVHDLARKVGYTSISHDLVFGLPKQTVEDITNTVTKTISLNPDRISLYSYAHVPWIKGNGQRGYDESDLPQDNEKRALYEKSKTLLLSAGYLEIGMDHFAKPGDDLALAFKQKKLHRNFMGYTTQATNFLLGLGMSAISDCWYGFAQNDKSVESYTKKVNEGIIPVFRGHKLNELDLKIRKHILELMCQFETTLSPSSKNSTLHHGIKMRLRELQNDGLVRIKKEKISITDSGIPFVRNVCMAFDQYLIENERVENMFSKTI